MGSRAGVDGRKNSSPPGFDPGPSSPKPVAIPTELPGPRIKNNVYKIVNKKTGNRDAETRKIEYRLRLVVNNAIILFLKQKWLFSVQFYNIFIVNI